MNSYIVASIKLIIVWNECFFDSYYIVCRYIRLRASRILMINMRGLGAEICKNLILAGVKSVTMLDDQEVTEEDFVSQFLVAREQLGKNVS